MCNSCGRGRTSQMRIAKTIEEIGHKRDEVTAGAMGTKPMLDKTKHYLDVLCNRIPTRRVGSEGNRKATEFFAETMESFGFDVQQRPFDCIDWESDGVELRVTGEEFRAYASPYSQGCKTEARLYDASTVEEVEAGAATGGVLLLHGAVAQEQLMPKNFPWYNPDHHRRIIASLEDTAPAAIIAATGRNPEVAGAVYPFPLIEDGDFNIPSVYMTEEDGERLRKHVGEQVWLESRARRIPSIGHNVTARKAGRGSLRLVFFAHIDAKIGTPGALDNAAGVAVMLLLGELLADYEGLGIEITALNGEDYYDNPGEKLWLAENEGSFHEILLGINVDDIGYYKGNTAYSFYGCPANIEGVVREVFGRWRSIREGEQWYQGDHSILAMNGVPALALTSSEISEILAEIAHTPKDTPQLVEPSQLLDAAMALPEVVDALQTDLGAD